MQPTRAEVAARRVEWDPGRSHEGERFALFAETDFFGPQCGGDAEAVVEVRDVDVTRAHTRLCPEVLGELRFREAMALHPLGPEPQVRAPIAGRAPADAQHVGRWVREVPRSLGRG